MSYDGKLNLSLGIVGFMTCLWLNVRDIQRLVKLGYQQEQSMVSFSAYGFFFIEWQRLPSLQMVSDLYGAVYFIAI